MLEQGNQGSIFNICAVRRVSVCGFTCIHLTTLWRDGEGEGAGVIGTGTRSPSIMVRTLSGMSVASLHWSCQLLSFDVRMSLACAPVARRQEKRRLKRKT